MAGYGAALASSFADFMFNTVRDEWNNVRRMQASDRAMRIQQANYEKNIKDARAYNEQFIKLSPTLEKEGYQMAGINPNLTDGVGMSVSAGPADSNISAPDYHYDGPQFTPSNSPFMSALVTQAQVNNLEANTAKLYKELPEVEAMTEYYKSSKHLNEAQAESLAVNNRKTQAEINMINSQTELTKGQQRVLEQQIKDVVPKNLELLESQLKLNAKDLKLKDSQIYLNNENAKTFYSQRQVNLANVHNLQELAQKTMFEALTGQISYTIAAETFASVVERILQENQTDTKQSAKTEALTINAKDYPTYFQCMQWYNEVVSSLLRPIGEVLGVALRGIK